MIEAYPSVVSRHLPLLGEVWSVKKPPSEEGGEQSESGESYTNVHVASV